MNDVHIGDFWQNKRDPKVIYYVDNFAFELEIGRAFGGMKIICSGFSAVTDKNKEVIDFLPQRFLTYTTADKLKKQCNCILSAERIAKDTRVFKADQDIWQYLIEKVGGKHGK